MALAYGEVTEQNISCYDSTKDEKNVHHDV